MNRSSQYSAEDRDFLAETLSRDIFSAFEAARKTRAREQKLDRNKLCHRIGKDKTGVSKLLSGPGNWTLRTLSDYANALELDVVITLVDRVSDDRYFCREGVRFVSEYMCNNYVLSPPQNSQLSLNHPVSLSACGVANAPIKAGAPEATHGNYIVY